MGREESSFNAWIKQRRRALDMTQEDLADRVGCSTTTIQKIELGERRPSKQVAQRLAECLNIRGEQYEDFVRFARGEPGAGGLFTDAAVPSPSRQPSPAGGDRPNANNLPAPLTLLLGREQAIAAAREYLLREDTRLLTFTGAPGIGKTRLSLKVASELLPYFVDGVFFVELAPVTDPARVAPAIAATFGLSESKKGAMESDLKDYLHSKRMLLVLDNFEQVLDAASTVVDLLRSCPYLKVLVTSREALHVPGEQQFPLAPLELPDLAHMPGIEALPGYPGIALFAERATATDPGFALTRDNARDVTTVCTRLDGLPLAIELAAARVTLLSMPEMAARLDKQLSLLANPSRGHFRHLPARQQTMRSAIEWSFRLLKEEEQQLLSQLSVFVGGWTLEAAEAVCGPDAPDGIQSLLEKSLLKRDATLETSRERRFAMLASIREYASEELETGDEAEDVRRRHALYFRDLVERAEPHLTGAEQAKWFQRLEREHSNLVAAMSWSLARGEADIALRFGGALRAFWYDRYWMEGQWWLEGILEGALKLEPEEPSGTRARALYSAAMVLRKIRDYPQARAMLEEALQIYRALGDSLNTGDVLRQLAHLVSDMNLPGDKELAAELYKESLEQIEAVGNAKGVSRVLTSLGEDARGERDYPRAIDFFERALVINRGMKDAQAIAANAGNLGFVLYNCGEYERAIALFDEALLIYQATASAFNASWILIGCAGVERSRSNLHKAATLAGASDALSASGGTLFDPNDQRDREEIEAAIRADLSEEEGQAAQERGGTMSMDEAIAYARGQDSAGISDTQSLL